MVLLCQISIISYYHQIMTHTERHEEVGWNGVTGLDIIDIFTNDTPCQHRTSHTGSD